MAVLNPTWDEFKDFNEFVLKHQEQLESCGYLLVQPPQEWFDLMNNKNLEAFQHFQFRPKKVAFKANEDQSGYGINTGITSRGDRQTVADFKQKSSNECPSTAVNNEQCYINSLSQWEAECGVGIQYDLFPEDLTVWNLNALGDYMSKTFEKQNMGKDIPGLTSAIVSVGAFGAASTLRTEDHNLHYISYIHDGMPIEWTVFPSLEKHKIDLLYPKIAPEHDCEFNELERHKVGFLHPFGKLATGLQMSMFTQRPQQFVIVGPGAYHQRYNKGDILGGKGFNIASSISFGTKEWMLHVPDCTICPGHSKEAEGSESSRGDGQSESDFETISEEDKYKFEEEDEPKPKRGRPRDPRKIENPAARPSKMCPECRSVQDKNFDRHLNIHFDVSTKAGRRDKKLAKAEAARRTVQGIRESHMELLPQSIQESLRNDPLLQFGFRQFLDDVGVAYPRETQETKGQQKRKREDEEESDITEKDEEDTQEENQCISPGPKSARKRLQNLGYPPLDNDKTLTKVLLQYSEGDHQRSTFIKNSLCQIRRVLGYVEYMTEKKDSHGWVLLLETEKMKEYIQIVGRVGGAAASTAKNYVDKMRTVMKLTQQTFFDEVGLPTDPMEHKKYMDNLRKATNEMTDFCHRKVEERDRDLAVKKAALGEALPDIAAWEEYILDEENLEKFHDYLQNLEDANQKDIDQLACSPDKSALREAFNFIVEFTATRQLFLAARPGELSKCTFTEVTMAKSFRDALHINVARHKTGRIKQATIAIEKKDQETFLRYVAILKRFKSPPAYGFPFLSPTRGFVEHNKIYRRMNLWLEKRGKERFTCTKLRKTVETTVDLYGTEKDKELVGSGLNHSAGTIKKHYRVQTSEKSAAEKAAIKRSAAESKLRSLFTKKPTQFDVNIHEGPLNQDKLTTWARAEMKIEDLDIRDELYSVYLTNWRISAKPLMVEECRSALNTGSSMKEIEEVLSSSVYESIKADVLMELKKLLQLNILQPCVLLEKAFDI